MKIFCLAYFFQFILSTRTSLANNLIFIEANRAFVKLVIALALVVIIRISFVFEFFDKVLINIVFVALTVKILSKFAIA